MRKFTAFILLFGFLFFNGCNSQQQPKSLSHDTSMKNAIRVIPDNAFRFSDQVDTKTDFQYYSHMHGSSSVNSRILIYRYDDYLVFAVVYQYGAESAMETYYLTQTQGEIFLDLANNYTETENIRKGLTSVGGDKSEYLLNLDGNEKNVLPLDLSPLNLLLTDRNALFDADFLNELTKENTNDYIMSSRIGMAEALLNCIRTQINKTLPSPLAALSANQIGDIDSIMTATLEDGKEYQILVTNEGCLVAVSEKKAATHISE